MTDEREHWSELGADAMASLIRDVSQGPGLSLEAVNEWLASWNAATDGADELLIRVKEASELITNREHREAIRNALALDGKGKNLTDRRMAYLQNHDISYRTLVRHETMGATAIAQMLPRLGEVGVSPTTLLMERIDTLEALLQTLVMLRLEDEYYDVYLDEMEGDDTYTTPIIRQLQTAIRSYIDRVPGWRELILAEKEKNAQTSQ